MKKLRKPCKTCERARRIFPRRLREGLARLERRRINEEPQTREQDHERSE